MKRLPPALPWLCVGLLSAILGLALVVQYQLFKENRLRLLSEAHAVVMAELREAVEHQLQQGADLPSASRVLARFTSLPSHPDLVSSVEVVDAQQRSVMRYTVLSLEEEATLPLDLRHWPAGWSLLPPDSSGGTVATVRRGDVLHIATPLQRPGAQADSPPVGLLVVGQLQPVGVGDFVFGSPSPALFVLAVLLACGLGAMVLAWRMPDAGHVDLMAGEELAPLRQEIERLEQAHAALQALALASPTEPEVR